MRRIPLRRLLPPSIALLSVSTLVIGACDPIVDVRGHVPTPGSLEKLEVGTQSRDDVERLLGSPSTKSTFALGNDTWYYISQRQESLAFFEPKIAEQKVTAIAFGENGRIKSIKTYGLQDAKDVTMVDRKTPTAGKELTVLEQIFGNVGRFGAPKK
ncbi:outer membrane protein assembly factor BamE [Vineibacter terrae]|uniref:outer membrane protein assembly factor BamE n=1 Tax=Vineibacter terrae TaxID=2586908 RepID=UPI002E331A9A|nr:outer membrane protein assembly factor BamE [Vineibacter terrae]HEX2892035.1 outer membrane protein assembly factor BamE [Vineibacter terrae]